MYTVCLKIFKRFKRWQENYCKKGSEMHLKANLKGAKIFGFSPGPPKPIGGPATVQSKGSNWFCIVRFCTGASSYLLSSFINVSSPEGNITCRATALFHSKIGKVLISHTTIIDRMLGWFYHFLQSVNRGCTISLGCTYC